MMELRCPWCGTVNRIPETRAGSPARCGRCGQPLATTLTPVHVTDATFDAIVTRASSPVLVDFWADWCGPCHAIAPVLDQIAAERNALKVVKRNIDEEPALAQRYGVMSIPTLMLFKDREPAAAAVRAVPKSMLDQRIGL